MQNRLVLFDIDGTLVDTGGAGLWALRRAAQDLFGAEGPQLDLAGATDSGIVRGMFAHFGEEPFPERLSQFYDRYLGYLAEHLAAGTYQGRVLPGVSDLLAHMAEAGAVLGLLTGNIARGAALKVQHYGLASYFDFGAYGDDHHDRNKLGPLAIDRARVATGLEFLAPEILVIGDTPKDIACGKAIGATTVCVATGVFSASDLRTNGADHVFENFEDLNAVVQGIS